MIDLQLTARHHDELDSDLQAYVERKIGHLDKYMPKGHEVVRGNIVLEYDHSAGDGNQYMCEARLEIPGADLYAKDGTVNLYAAVDIVDQKLKAQILKYKDKHDPSRNRRRLGLGKRQAQAEEVIPTDSVDSSTD